MVGWGASMPSIHGGRGCCSSCCCRHGVVARLGFTCRRCWAVRSPPPIPHDHSLNSTRLDSLSSPPSATHACTITFILGSRCPRLCLQGLKLACFGEALHETEESRTHQARHIPLAAVSCSILSLFLCFSIVSALHLPLSIFHFYFL